MYQCIGRILDTVPDWKVSPESSCQFAIITSSPTGPMGAQLRV